MTTQNDRLVLNSILNPNLPLGEGVFDPKEEDVEVQDDTEPKVSEDGMKIEREGMMTAEQGNIDQAIHLFTQVIEKYPEYASAYNNRAQAYRLKSDTRRAMEDLEVALKLSNKSGKVGASALCQRGIIQRKFGHDDSAIEDFKEAANLGSGFAKSMLVEMNPYAAMCNAMLKNVFTAMALGQPPRMPAPEPSNSG